MISEKYIDFPFLIKVIFILGSSNDSKVEENVLKEDMKHKDILQFHFIDSYHNCLLKSIGALRWTLFYCKSAKFIMKVDDDMIVNVNKLVKFVHDNNNATKSIYGKVHDSKPIRWPKSKWYINQKAYSTPDYLRLYAGLVPND